MEHSFVLHFPVKRVCDSRNGMVRQINSGKGDDYELFYKMHRAKYCSLH